MRRTCNGVRALALAGGMAAIACGAPFGLVGASLGALAVVLASGESLAARRR